MTELKKMSKEEITKYFVENQEKMNKEEKYETMHLLALSYCNTDEEKKELEHVHQVCKNLAEKRKLNGKKGLFPF
jgi:ribonuclease HI